MRVMPQEIKIPDYRCFCADIPNPRQGEYWMQKNKRLEAVAQAAYRHLAEEYPELLTGHWNDNDTRESLATALKELYEIER